MPFLSRHGGEIYFDDAGRGEVVVAMHGLSENADYWTVSGIADRLRAHCRFIAVDLRGHGRSRVTSESSPGFDVITLADDVGGLADELGLGPFHLLGHATGGMVAARYATEHPDRLASLILAGTSSATGVVPPAKVEKMAAGFRGKTWDELMKDFRANPGPFLFHLDQAPDADALWAKAEAMFRIGDPDLIAAFISSFYDDPDPRSDALQSITCPTLVIAGERDVLMRPSSEALARGVRNATLVVIPDVGHMSALENPDAFADAIIRFFGHSDRANRQGVESSFG